MADNNDRDDLDDDLDDAAHPALVVHTSHSDAHTLVWVEDHGAGGEAGLHLVRVPDLGGETGDEPEPIRTLFALARRQRARWVILDEDGGAVLPGVPTYGAGE